MSDMMKEVPLVELLRGVPPDARLLVPVDHGTGAAWKAGSQNYPVGAYCHAAAAEIKRLAAELAAAKYAILSTKPDEQVTAHGKEIEAKSEKVCEWAVDDDGAWHTGCDMIFEFTAGGPIENKAKWCCYCGGKVVVKSPVPKGLEERLNPQGEEERK